MSRLSRVGGSVQQVADAIACALKLEVEIIDDELIRIAATGQVRSGQGSRLARGEVNKHVLSQGLYIFIEEAGYDRICQECSLVGRCHYHAYLVYPIKIENEVIGTICLMAFDRGQKALMQRQYGSLVEFVAQMAQLISSQVVGEEVLWAKSLTAQQLRVVVNSVHEGVLAFDEEKNLTHINEAALRLLGVEKAADRETLGPALFDVLALAKILATGKSYAAKIKELPKGTEQIKVIATARPIKGLQGRPAGVVVSLQDYGETRARIARLTPTVTTLTFADIIANNATMKLLLRQAAKVAHSSSTVLLLGESGTGKDIFAQAIHSAGATAQKPFIAINCGAIPESLLESELFGYEEGAFTGARKGGKPGKFELARGGTLFLDEVGSMSLYLQNKLLRVLQDKVVERVGSSTGIKVDVRVIAATNADLQQLVANGRFREDLYYRLSVIPFRLPPLRERKEDIPALLNFYKERYAHLLGKNMHSFTKDALQICMDYNWPGNIRELINAVEYAVNLAPGPFIGTASLPQRIREAVGKDLAIKAAVAENRGMPTWDQLEKNAIKEALEHFGWDEEGKTLAARALGVSRATIYRRIKKYGLQPCKNGARLEEEPCPF